MRTPEILLQSKIYFLSSVLPSPPPPGHVNHSLFWQNLAPSKSGGGELKDGPLKEAIDRDFGGLDQLKTKFNAQLAGIQGSGWGWLGLNPTTKKLDIVTTANQDPLLCEYE